MLDIKEEELKTILPLDGPSTEEVQKYLEKYNDEYIVIKCGGSVLIDQNLFNIFIIAYSCRFRKGGNKYPDISRGDSFQYCS